MSSQPVNRVAVSLQLIDTKDTTLLHSQIQQALQGRKHLIKALKYFNYTLIALIAVAALFLLIELIFGRNPYKSKPVEQVSLTENPIRTPANFLRPDNSDLQQLVTRRNIFEPVTTVDGVQNMAVDAAKTELYSKFRIVGVFIDQPSKAIIEVVSSGETVFVTEGEQVEGATLKKIFEEKLIFDYNGVQLELSR